MQRTLEQAPAPAATVPTLDLQAKLKEAMENVADGDTEGAAQAMAQLLALQAEQVRQQTLTETQHLGQRQAQQQLLDQATDDILTQFEFLREGHDDFDPLVNTQIIALRDVLYQSQGGHDYSIGDALYDATETILRSVRPDLIRDSSAPAESLSNGPGEATAPAADELTALRNQLAALERKLGATGGQPASLARAGDSGTPLALDAAVLTDEAFDQLTEQQRAALRGDFI